MQYSQHSASPPLAVKGTDSLKKWEKRDSDEERCCGYPLLRPDQLLREVRDVAVGMHRTRAPNSLCRW